MKARIMKVSESGACTYCRKGEVKAGGMGLEYPYEEVIKISGNQSSSQLCHECAEKIVSAYRCL